MSRAKEPFAAGFATARRARGEAACRPNLDRKAYLGLAIEPAFPLPSTGAFSDLLSAIDSADDSVPDEIS
jgi:uncharacterized membrane protein